MWQASSSSTGLSAYSTIQAAEYWFYTSVGVQTTTDTGGGMNVAYISASSWLAYESVEFGTQTATQFAIRIASGVKPGDTGHVEVRLDSIANAPICTVPVASTGGWQTWVTETAAMASGVTGTHTVYLTFSSSQPNNFVNLRWFSFG